MTKSCKPGIQFKNALVLDKVAAHDYTTKAICALKPSFWNVNMAGLISIVQIFEQKSQIVKHDLVLGTRDKIGYLNFQFLQSTFEFQRKRRAQD